MRVKLVHNNFLLYFSIFIGLLSNLLLIYNLKSVRTAEELSCHIDMESLTSLVEKQRIEEEMKHRVEFTPLMDRTLQTLLFAFPGGVGLGNKLFELIALRGIADTLQRTPIINVVKGEYVEALLNRIQPIFPLLLGQYQLRIVPSDSITRQKANFGTCCKFDDPMKFVNNSAQHLLLEGHYFQSYKYFSHLRKSVREWLTPDKMTLLKAELMLPQANRNDFIICTHVRRGDFATDGLHQPSDPYFTRAAVDFLVKEYKKSHKKVNAVILGNDVDFANAVFEDKVENATSIMFNSSKYDYELPDNSPEYTTFIMPTLNPEIDLAFSRAYCDVTLITAPSSTFGWWISYLAKPSAITYYRDIIESKDGVAREMRQEDFYPPEWIKLVTNNGTISRAG